MKRKIPIFFLASLIIVFSLINKVALCQPSVNSATKSKATSEHKTAPEIKTSKEESKKGGTKMEKEIKTERAMFGAGCFWGVEETFRRLPGVMSTAVGFSGGTVKDPSYERVCAGDTKHAEIVEIDYDPKQISYDDLLKTFFANHDPTTLNRQGPDVGDQYRSVIFYTTADQEKKAIAAKAEWQAKTGKTAATLIEAAKPFYKAEEYHQRYLEKRGLNVCH